HGSQLFSRSQSLLFGQETLLYLLPSKAMKLSTKSRLDSLVSTTALSFTVAVLVCLSLVFV
ncbi:unnamed protein product, partial [Penicillium salamii]